MKKNNQNGSLLIEVLVSMSIMVTFAAAIGGLMTSNNRLVTAADHQTSATALAKEAMEMTYAIKNADWQGIGGKTPGYYIAGRFENIFTLTQDAGVPPGELVQEIYTRTIKISQGYRDAQGNLAASEAAGVVEAPEVRLVEVAVSWAEHGETQDVRLASYLTHWK